MKLPAVPPLVALAAALAMSAAAPAAWAQAAAAPAAAAASAPAFAVRPEVGTALNQVIELFRGGKTAEAKTRLEQAQATIQNQQPAEVTVMHRIRGLLELQLEQYAAAVKSFESALAVGAQSAQDALQCQESLARAHFNLKAYPAAAEAARKAQAAGSKAPAMQTVLVRATYLQNDHAGTTKLLEAQQQRDGKLSVDDLRLLASSYGQLKDEANYLRLAETLLRDHGRKEYWPDLLSRVQRQADWQARWDIDVYRLRLQLDLMDEADDYLVLADMAARAGLPAEAQKVVDAGFAKGLLGKGSGAADHERLRTAVTRQANDDRQSLSAAAVRPPAVGDARAAANTFNTGAALVSAGQADRGLELMKAALAGPLADPAQARLQHAQALARSGRTAEAAEAFKALGSDPGLGLLARLWALAIAPPQKG